MKVAATHLTAAANATLLAESERRRIAAHQRREQAAAFESALSDEQRHQRALFEVRARANRLRTLPTCFGHLA